MQDQRINISATKSRNVRTFRGGAYVADLMAELSRVAIAQRIAQARDESGLKQHELADLLGVHIRTVQYWEAKAEPTVAYERMDELAEVLGVDKKWLLHGNAEPTASPQQELLREVAGGVADLVEEMPRLGDRLARIEAALGIGGDEQASPGTGTNP